MPDADQRGIYRKFHVTRADGTDVPGGKHDGCAYFVLDLDHDEHARAALEAYAAACAEQRPTLARDLRQALAATPCGCREAVCGHQRGSLGGVVAEKILRDDICSGRRRT